MFKKNLNVHGRFSLGMWPCLSEHHATRSTRTMMETVHFIVHRMSPVKDSKFRFKWIGSLRESVTSPFCCTIFQEPVYILHFMKNQQVPFRDSVLPGIIKIRVQAMHFTKIYQVPFRDSIVTPNQQDPFMFGLTISLYIIRSLLCMLSHISQLDHFHPMNWFRQFAHLVPLNRCGQFDIIQPCRRIYVFLSHLTTRHFKATVRDSQ